MTHLDDATLRRHRRRNRLQAVALGGGIAAVAGLAGWVVAGTTGLIWTALMVVLLLAFRPRIPPKAVLRMYGAQPLPVAAAPDLHRLVSALAARAGLPRAPQLHYVPSTMLNAFAVGDPDDAVIGVTDGILRGLTGRELAGVLAHEISHIRANDLWIMTLADTIGRLTHGLAYVGLLLLLLGAPLLAAGHAWPMVLATLLALLPTVVTLLQLALSRAREYDADLEAARLTGDPDALADALQRLERREGRIWERILVPHRRTPDPLLLRTHPPTEERVRRLRALVPEARQRLPGTGTPYLPDGYRRVTAPRQLRYPGIRW
jgi:heat shock protein HtpX